MDGLIVNYYLNNKGNLMREAWNMVLQIETDQIRLSGIDAPPIADNKYSALMGSVGVP